MSSEKVVEIERSVIINSDLYKKQINNQLSIKNYINLAWESGEIKFVEIRDYYIDSKTRIRIQDDKITLTAKIINTIQEDAVYETSKEITSEEFAKYDQNLLKELVKTRLIIPLDCAKLHIDIYEGRMLGLVKLDLEVDSELSYDKINAIFEKYSHLLKKGYDFSQVERELYGSNVQINQSLPYQMVNTNLNYSQMNDYEKIKKSLEIDEQKDLDYIHKVLRVLKNPKVQQKLKQKQLLRT